MLLEASIPKSGTRERDVRLICLAKFLIYGIFLIRKMNEFRKQLTQASILERLRAREITLSPLTLRLLRTEPRFDGRTLDALVEASWKNCKAKFVVEFKTLSTPKAFQDATNTLRTLSLPKDCLPMVILPFLSEDQLQKLEQEGISGIDLCGNGFVSAPNKFSVFRTGAKNKFPTYAPIKNIYQKNTSMVGRVLLAQSAYDTVQAIRTEINQRNLLVKRWGRTPMTLATVSKALKRLEEDLIIDRSNEIRLLQPERLLEKLNQNFKPPQLTNRIRFKPDMQGITLYEALGQQSEKMNLPITATGASSVSQYAVMQRGDVVSVYCPRAASLLEGLPGSQTDRFPNLEILETTDETVYFDARQKGGFTWASPIQVFLELVTGDKRDQETAVQVKDYLLSSVRQLEP